MSRKLITIALLLGGVLCGLYFLTDVFKPRYKSVSEFGCLERILKHDDKVYYRNQDPKKVVFSDDHLNRVIRDYRLCDLYNTTEGELRQLFRNQVKITADGSSGEGLDYYDKYTLTIVSDSQEKSYQLAFSMFNSLFRTYRVERLNAEDVLHKSLLSRIEVSEHKLKVLLVARLGGEVIDGKVLTLAELRLRYKLLENIENRGDLDKQIEAEEKEFDDGREAYSRVGISQGSHIDDLIWISSDIPDEIGQFMMDR